LNRKLSGCLGGGDGICSPVLSSTSALFQNFNSDLRSLLHKCLEDLSLIEKSSEKFQKQVETIYNNCNDSLLGKVNNFAEKVAAAVGGSVTPDEVGDSILSGDFLFGDLNCIAGKLSKIYPLAVSHIENFNQKVEEILKSV
jgi:hypothetical protein